MLAGISPPQEEWLEGTGGRIFVRHWRPPGEVKAALTICHGIHAHGGHYERAAAEFAAHGFAVTVLDLRGRGKSDGERFYAESIDDYVADLALAIGFAKARDPGLQCFLLGHSAGGVTAVSYALDYQDRIDGLICESFAYHVYAPDFALTLLKGASHIAPHAHVLELKMADFSRDPEWVERLQADPLIKGESQPVKTVAAFARAGDRMKQEFDRITLPLLIMHGTADKATRPDGSQEFFDNAGSKDKQLNLYEGYYHDLLNDVGREKVMTDIENWLDEHVRPASTDGLEMPLPGV